MIPELFVSFSGLHTRLRNYKDIFLILEYYLTVIPGDGKIRGVIVQKGLTSCLEQYHIFLGIQQKLRTHKAYFRFWISL